MNANEINEKIQTRINEICETNRNRYRRQYPITKWAREQLQALGLWEMVQNYRNGSAGQTDAQDILNDATTQVGGGFNADGEGEAWSYTGEIGGLLKQLQAAQADDDDDGSGTGTIDDDLFEGVDEQTIQEFLTGGLSEMTIDDMPEMTIDDMPID